jgi:hypothetical protein
MRKPARRSAGLKSVHTWSTVPISLSTPLAEKSSGVATTV